MLQALSTKFDAGQGSFADDALQHAFAAASGHADLRGVNEKAVKATCMPFIKAKMAEVQAGGAQVLSLLCSTHNEIACQPLGKIMMLGLNIDIRFAWKAQVSRTLLLQRCICSSMQVAI